MDNKFPLLIVGLGNPGKDYERTRHNIGARVLEALAKDAGITFKKTAKLEGYVGAGSIDGVKAVFLFPTTYMNLSGRAVQKCMAYYKVPVSNLLVLADDIYLPFADLRLKLKGGSGGHNGLKDIAGTLGTTDYPRLKIGIGEKESDDLNDHVLGRFTKEEELKLDDLIEKCIHEIKTKFLSGDNLPSNDNHKEDLRSN